MATYALYIYDASSFTQGFSQWFGAGDGATSNAAAQGTALKTGTLSGQMIAVSDTNSFLNDDPTAGSQVLAEDVTINGVTYAAGTAISVDYAIEGDANGTQNNVGMLAIRIGSTIVGVAVIDPTKDNYIDINVALEPNSTYTFDAISNYDGSRAKQPYTSLITCFTVGTRIDTAHGPVAIEELAVGDLVLTRDHGP